MIIHQSDGPDKPIAVNASYQRAYSVRPELRNPASSLFEELEELDSGSTDCRNDNSYADALSLGCGIELLRFKKEIPMP